MFPTRNKNFDPYERHIYNKMWRMCHDAQQRTGLFNTVALALQGTINRIIPQKVHDFITKAMKGLIKGIATGSQFVAPKPRLIQHIKFNEEEIKKRIRGYKTTAAAEGGVTGSFGFWGSLADFPLLLSIKIKLLYDIAAFYGRDLNKQEERVYLLLVFQLAFSKGEVKKTTLNKLIRFEEYMASIEQNDNNLDWQSLQQQYRDYLDIAKLLQMVPVIGAAVGTVTNYRLLRHLGDVAMNCYRIRYFQDREKQQLLNG